MNLRKRWIGMLLAVGLVAVIAACGSDSSAADQAAAPALPATSVPSRVVSTAVSTPDEITNGDPTVEAHVDDVHEEPDEAAHEATESEAGAHADEGTVDPDAPLIHVIGSEFAYSPASFEVEAGHAFTLMLHNEGGLEHDITIEGFEEMGGIHLIAGEDGMNTFTLDEPGEYTYYCTIPGHREAGMVGTLVVSAAEAVEGV